MTTRALARTHLTVSGTDDSVVAMRFPLGILEVAEIAEVRMTAIAGFTHSGGSSSSARCIGSMSHSEAVLADPPDATALGEDPNLWWIDGWAGFAAGLVSDLETPATLKTPYPAGFFIGGSQYFHLDANVITPRLRVEVWYYRVPVPQKMKLWVTANTVRPINPRDQR